MKVVKGREKEKSFMVLGGVRDGLQIGKGGVV